MDCDEKGGLQRTRKYDYIFPPFIMGLKIASFVNDGRVLDVRLWGWWWCVRLMNNRKVCKAKCSNFNTKHIETLCSTKRWKKYNERKSWCSLMLFLVCAGGEAKHWIVGLNWLSPEKMRQSRRNVCVWKHVKRANDYVYSLLNFFHPKLYWTNVRKAIHKWIRIKYSSEVEERASLFSSLRIEWKTMLARS